MIAGLIQYSLGGKYLGVAGLHPAIPDDPAADRRQKRRVAFAALGALAVLGILGALAAAGAIAFTAEMISNALGVALVILSVAVFSWLLLGRGWSAEERKRSAAILVLFLSSAVFWFAFEQAGSSLNLFAEGSVNRWCTDTSSRRVGTSWCSRSSSLRLRRCSPGSGPYGEARALQPRQVCSRPILRERRIRPAGAGSGRPGGLAALVDRHLLPAYARRVVPQPRRIERHDQAGAHARSRNDDGSLVRFHRRGQLPGGRMASLYGSMTIPTLFAITAAFAMAAAIAMVPTPQAHRAPDVGVK